MNDEEQRFEIVDVFKHRKRVCVIVHVKWQDKYQGYPSYNGYVSLKKKEPKDHSKFEYLAEDGLTYDGYFAREWKDKKKSSWLPEISEDLYFFGFDTLHAWNIRENASYEAVRRKTINMANKMIREGI